jgi:rsbT co-antagonist protein RsbR
MECRGLHKDGTWHYFQAEGTNCLDDPVLKGVVVVSRDITFHKEMEEALKRSEAALKEALEKLRVSLEELYTPVVQVWANVLALPLMGVMDDRRAQQIMETLLRRIVETQSELVILDVTGAPAVDTQVMNYLMKTISAASLMGAQCVLTGMKPDLAHSVIKFGLDLDRLVIRSDMEEGLKWALEQVGYEASDKQASLAKEAVQERQR